MLKEKLSLVGKTAIVTGGGQGLGRGFCKAFAEMGADVVIAELNRENGREAAEEIAAMGVKSLFVETDVTSRKNMGKMVEQALGLTGRIDIMVNNAGVTGWREAELVSEEEWRRLWAVNLDGVFYGCQAVFETMRNQGGGSIINMGSMSGHIVNVPQCQASYNSSKAAVIHLTRSLAVEWAKYKIRVNSISPGYMLSPMAARFFDDPDIGPMWRNFTPMRRGGDPDELCAAAVMLASDASGFTTGSDIVIDGGYTCM